MTFSAPKVRTIPDPILEQPTQAIENEAWATWLPMVERDLRAAMKVYPAVGFAANQVGHGFRVCIVERNDDSLMLLVNPEIIRTSFELEQDWEGCMSIPDKKALVDRYTTVMVRHQVSKKKTKVTMFRDYEARVVQHEVDHLDGKTILDRSTVVMDVEREPTT